MKGLNKILLVSVIAAAPLAANAQLKALSDSSMSNMTGQAGVSIELSTKVDIGSVVYTDTATGASGDVGGGSLAINGIHIGGGAVTTDASGNVNGTSGNFDKVLANIDIAADGSAIIDVHSTDGLPIDYAVGVESVKLHGTAANDTVLAQNIAMTGFLGALNIKVDNTTSTLVATVAFSINDMSMDVPFLGMGISGLTLHGAGYNAALAASTGGAVSPADPTYFAQATVSMNTAAGAAAGAPANALHVAVGNFAADMNIASISLGGKDIGSLAINNLQVSNTDMIIYGH
jgi:hypothetical protein